MQLEEAARVQRVWLIRCGRQQVAATRCMTEGHTNRLNGSALQTCSSESNPDLLPWPEQISLRCAPQLRFWLPHLLYNPDMSAQVIRIIASCSGCSLERCGSSLQLEIRILRENWLLLQAHLSSDSPMPVRLTTDPETRSKCRCAGNTHMVGQIHTLL